MRVVTDTPGVTPYDAVLLLSFGGPEGPDDVMPFLENVTRGRGIPRERLEAVAGHYLRFGGRSPINDQNRALLAALRAELDARGIDVPLGWGNRNWSPYLVDALRELHEAGCRRVVVVVTSAYSSYSGCRQYREDLAAAVTALAAEGRELAVDKVRHYFNHPGFVAPVVDAVRSGLDGLPAEVRQGARVVFVTHSVPTAMNEVSGEGSAFGGGAYVSQHLDVASTVMAQVGGDAPAWDLVYCSRSGPPAQPWLEPDVNDHLRALAEDGVRAVVVVPVGFVSDHMEVVFDLDTEANQTAQRLGLHLVRVPTVGTDPRFVRSLVDLVVERAAQARGEEPARPAAGALGASHVVCPAGCCRNLRSDRPAACGLDPTVPAVAVAAPR